jgi:hypothetical protein
MTIHGVITDILAPRTTKNGEVQIPFIVEEEYGDFPNMVIFYTWGNFNKIKPFIKVGDAVTCYFKLRVGRSENCCYQNTNLYKIRKGTKVWKGGAS